MLRIIESPNKPSTPNPQTFKHFFAMCLNLVQKFGVCCFGISLISLTGSEKVVPATVCASGTRFV